MLLVALIASAFWAPLGLWLLFSGKAVDVGTSMGIAMAGVAVSALFHGTYFMSLQKGYSVGDMSLVYPLARGTGPLLSTVVAIAIYGERPSPAALVGAVFIAGGAFILTRSAKSGDPTSAQGPSQGNARNAVMWGLITGVFIAGYTVWDKHVLSHIGVSPLFLEWGTCVIRAAVLGPILLIRPAPRRRFTDALPALWRTAMTVAILSPFSYMMVLSALKVSPVSYVAPTREISILIGTLFGSRLLGEGDPRAKRNRAIAAAAMALGVAALALG